VDPLLIDADDRHRAVKESLRSPDVRRMIKYAWPHRRLIALGMVASVFYGLLHSVSILGVMPVLSVLISDEGLHGWVYRRAAEDALDAQLDVQLDTATDGTAIKGVRVLRIKGDSPLPPLNLPATIEGVEGSAIESIEDLRRLARTKGIGEIALTLLAAQQTDEQSISIKPQRLSLTNRLLMNVASLVPVAKQRTDRVRTLAYVLGVVVCLVIISNAARFIAQYYVAAGVLRSVMDLRRVLYRKVLRLPMDFFSQNTSDLVSRFVQDAQEIQRGMMAVFGKLVREPIKAAFILAAALVVNAQLTITMLLVAPVVVIIFWAVGRKIRKANKRVLQAYGQMIGALGTTLQAIGVVKAYNAEQTERLRAWRIDRKLLGQQLRIARLEALVSPTLEILGVVAIAGVTIWLGAQVAQGRLEMVEFGTVLVALAALMDPLRKFADVYPRVMRSAAGARRIFSVIDAPAEAELLSGATRLGRLQRSIEFHDVHFTYPGATTPALDGVSLTINQGETVAIVGPNGSGKTTLIKLLVRFHDPQSGRIDLDGADIRTATIKSLRRQISLVTQDPVVFAMSIAENIAYGTRRREPVEIEQAARRAHADDFILAKDGGYEELIGERGVTLSGGQRQRICIARAILRDTPILIFDEATSQIDSESEEKIQDAIRQFAVGRTTILIAHRLSTIRFARRVVVMDAGRVIDSGTHEELLDRCELYATLCRTQLAATV